MMRITLLFALWMTTSHAFCPLRVSQQTTTTTTQLDMVDRRHVLAQVATLGLLLNQVVEPAHAKGSTFFFDETIETVREPAQMPTGDKIDLNSAFVGDYKYFRGMFPHAAGKIASNGPYEAVSDIYKIPGLTANDKKLFKQYHKYFTVNPPGRAFDERINARVST